MSALFYTGEVVGYSSGIGMNPYTLEKPHTEAINIDLVTRIFPACIKDYDSATGLAMVNNTTVFVSESYDQISRKVSMLKRDAYGRRLDEMLYD